MTVLNFSIILAGVILNAIAQLFLKAGTNALGVITIEASSIFFSFFRILFQPFILAGLLCYVFSVSIWIVALSKVPVSIAYPMLSIGYVVNIFAAWYLFGETLATSKIIGTIIIIIGVYIISKN